MASTGKILMILLLTIGCGATQTVPTYTIYDSYDDVIKSEDAIYSEAVRVTPTSDNGQPAYHGFYFYNCKQFDPTGRYMLAMRIYIEGREVEATDVGVIGIVDLQDNNKWNEIGRTTAWNWQQGARLQWRPGVRDEVIWNDRAEDGTHFVSRIYNTQTKQTRTLPRPFYALSSDGQTAMTHDFERMEHKGTPYVGISDKYEDEWAPKETGIFNMNLNTGESKMIMSVDQIADYIFPDGRPEPAKGRMFIFRESFNPSGTRFMTFIRDMKNKRRELPFTVTSFSMTPDGGNVRFLYDWPTHHFWIDDETIMDWTGRYIPPGKTEPVPGYYLYKDDGSGQPKELLFEAAVNGHDTYHPNREWVVTDTYSIDGYIYLYMYHLSTKKYVPIGKFKYMLGGKHFTENPRVYRVDLHPRVTPDGNIISIDSTHEGFGRQIYNIDISHIVDNPPR
jgi:hypothetical protein